MIYLNAANEFCFKGLTEEPSQLQSTVNLSIKLNDLELKQTFRNWASEKEKETKGLWMHCPAKASVISWLCFHIPSPPLWLYFYFSLSCLHPPSLRAFSHTETISAQIFSWRETPSRWYFYPSARGIVYRSPRARCLCIFIWKQTRLVKNTQSCWVADKVFVSGDIVTHMLNGCTVPWKWFNRIYCVKICYLCFSWGLLLVIILPNTSVDIKTNFSCEQ